MKKSTIINALVLLWFGLFFMVWATNELLKSPSSPQVIIATAFKWWSIVLVITAVIVWLLKRRNS